MNECTDCCTSIQWNILSNKKGRITDTYNDMNESRKYLEKKKPDTEDLLASV